MSVRGSSCGTRLGSTTSCGSPTTRTRPRRIRGRGSSSSGLWPACRRRSAPRCSMQTPRACTILTSPSAPLEAVPAGSPTRYRLLSADDHVQEPPDLWIKRLSRAKFGDRIPSLARQADGSERWVVDGQLIPLRGAGMGAALFADRTTEPQCWADVPPMVRDPSERLKAMDADGVEASVLYPTVAGVGGEAFGRITDPELELACVQAYNDWLIEEWAAVSDRFVPQCLVPLDPPEAAAEIRRAVAMGHRGVIYPGI